MTFKAPGHFTALFTHYSLEIDVPRVTIWRSLCLFLVAGFILNSALITSPINLSDWTLMAYLSQETAGAVEVGTGLGYPLGDDCIS